jgi:hypothetical protein
MDNRDRSWYNSPFHKERFQVSIYKTFSPSKPDSLSLVRHFSLVLLTQQLEKATTLLQTFS